MSPCTKVCKLDKASSTYCYVSAAATSAAIFQLLVPTPPEDFRLIEALATDSSAGMFPGHGCHRWLELFRQHTKAGCAGRCR